MKFIENDEFSAAGNYEETRDFIRENNNSLKDTVICICISKPEHLPLTQICRISSGNPVPTKFARTGSNHNRV